MRMKSILHHAVLLYAVLLCICLFGCVSVHLTKGENGHYAADVISGYPVIFRAVYASGENNDTPVRYSYIELYNTSKQTIRLDGKSLQYAEKDDDDYTSYAFPENAEIAGKSSYLIRCAQAVGGEGEAYLDVCERFSLTVYDMDIPSLVLSSKRCRLLLADTETALSQKDLSSGHALAYFGACAKGTTVKDFPFPKNSDALNKRTVICRTEDNRAWTAVDFSTLDSLSILSYMPCASAGPNTDIPLSGVTVTADCVGGRYSDPVKVTLSTLPGYQIVYSTDTSADVQSFKKYSGEEIVIDHTETDTYGGTTELLVNKYGRRVEPRPTSGKLFGASVLRACVTNGKEYGPVMTETYFVTPDIGDYDDILMINITLNPQSFTGKQGIYAVISDDIFQNRERCDGYMEVFDAIDAQNTANTAADKRYVQLVMNGNGSLAFQQKSMRVYMRDTMTAADGGTMSFDLFDGAATDKNGAAIAEFKTFLLRNSGNDASCAHFRDALMQEICRDMNAAIQAYRPSLLFINGEFWGVYNVRERYDKAYFASHYGVLPENLVMLESISPLLTGSWNTKYELNEGVPGDEEDFYALVDYVASHNMKDAEAFAYVEERMDLDNFMDFFIASCYLANTDWPGNNIKVWRNKTPGDPSGLDTRWRWVLADMDFGIGHSTIPEQEMFAHALTEDTVCGKLMTRLLKNGAYRLKFADRCTELCNSVFDPERTLPLLDKYVKRLEPHINMTFQRWPGDHGSMENWYNHIDAIENFLSKRTIFFIRELGKKLNVPIDIVTVEADHASVTANGVVIQENQRDKALYYRDSTDVTVKATAEKGYKVVGINLQIGPKTTYIEGDSCTFTMYARTTVEVLTEKE